MVASLAFEPPAYQMTVTALMLMGHVALPVETIAPSNTSWSRANAPMGSRAERGCGLVRPRLRDILRGVGHGVAGYVALMVVFVLLAAVVTASLAANRTARPCR